MSAKKITNNGFLNEFKRRHQQMQERPFCWVLGAGASVQSGIPAGNALANQWLIELHELEDFANLPIAQWATPENLGIRDFEYARVANFYSWIYQRRFRDYKEQGYAFLEDTMVHAEPSFGYSVLAQIMSTTPHSVAITTNFDNLIADALSIYTRTFPLVCGHESLAGFIRPHLRRHRKRPLIAKIHRDLFFEPKNMPDEVSSLPKEWAQALANIFDVCTPIVIGYGGNDGSLMDFLTTLAPIEGGILWCYREGSEIDPKIDQVVEHHHGRLVPIAGFDELMLQLQERLQLAFFLPQLQRIQEMRTVNYQRQFEVLTAALRKPAESPAAEEARKPARKAAEAAVERLTKEKDWWAWQLKANAEPDPDKCEAIFRAALEDFPRSAELTGNFANFMSNVRKDYDEAERLYGKALELDPNQAVHTGNFAVFMENVRKDYDEAERLYREAFRLDPDYAVNTGNFAVFLAGKRKNYDEAERFFRKSLELDPNDATNTGNFANFMNSVRNDYSEAERLYRKALELDSNNGAHTVNFAQFLGSMDRVDEARGLAVRAWELTKGTPGANRAEAAFTRWLLTRASGHDGTPALARLKSLIQDEFERTPWTFDQLLATLLPRCPENEHTLAYKLADAILDKAKVSALENEPLWTNIQPIPPSVPWPD